MPLPVITRSLPSTTRRAVRRALNQRAAILNRAWITAIRMRPARRRPGAGGVTAAAVTAAVLATAPAAVAAHATSLRYHTVNVPGSIATEVFGINDKGVFTGDYVPKNKPNVLAGYIDAHGRVTSFTYPTPTYHTHSIGINNQGTAVGFSQHGHSPYRGWLRSPSGRFTPLNDPAAGIGAGQGTEPQTINDHGVVAGFYRTSSDVFHGFVYRSGHFTTVDVPHAVYGKPGSGSEITGINNAGVMVGVDTPRAKEVIVGYVDTAGHFTSITGPGAGTRPGDATFANAISNTGVIVGTSNGPSGAQHGWVLSGSRFTTLHDPHATGAFGTTPEGINRHGVVVGIYLDARDRSHGFLVATGITGAASRPPSPPAATGHGPAGGTAHLAPASRTARPARQGSLAGHASTTR